MPLKFSWVNEVLVGGPEAAIRVFSLFVGLGTITIHEMLEMMSLEILAWKSDSPKYFFERLQ